MRRPCDGMATEATQHKLSTPFERPQPYIRMHRRNATILKCNGGTTSRCKSASMQQAATQTMQQAAGRAVGTAIDRDRLQAAARDGRSRQTEYADGAQLSGYQPMLRPVCYRHLFEQLT